MTAEPSSEPRPTAANCPLNNASSTAVATENMQAHVRSRSHTLARFPLEQACTCGLRTHSRRRDTLDQGNCRRKPHRRGYRDHRRDLLGTSQTRDTHRDYNSGQRSWRLRSLVGPRSTVRAPTRTQNAVGRTTNSWISCSPSSSNAD